MDSLLIAGNGPEGKSNTFYIPAACFQRDVEASKIKSLLDGPVLVSLPLLNFTFRYFKVLLLLWTLPSGILRKYCKSGINVEQQILLFGFRLVLSVGPKGGFVVYLCYFTYTSTQATCKQFLGESGLRHMWDLNLYFYELIISCIFSLCPRTIKSSVSWQIQISCLFSGIMEKKTRGQGTKAKRIYSTLWS